MLDMSNAKRWRGRAVGGHSRGAKPADELVALLTCAVSLTREITPLGHFAARPLFAPAPKGTLCPLFPSTQNRRMQLGRVLIPRSPFDFLLGRIAESFHNTVCCCEQLAFLCKTMLFSTNVQRFRNMAHNKLLAVPGLPTQYTPPATGWLIFLCYRATWCL